MVKYLNQLHADILQSIAIAHANPMPALAAQNYEAGEPYLSSICKPVKLGTLTGIPAEAFPPASFLDEAQIAALILDIELLWRSWQLNWTMPIGLSLFQQYAAMLHTMQHESVNWQPQLGGLVKVCQHEQGVYCPFGADGYCYCKAVSEAAKHDIELWEEHVRSQGLDPYSELTDEVEEAFDTENRKRDLRKRNEDDWQQLDLLDFPQETDENICVSNFSSSQFWERDWIDYLFWEDDEAQDSVANAKSDDNPNNQDDLLDGLLDEEDQNFSPL